MFNSKVLFTTLKKIPPLQISTGDFSRSLVAEGMATIKVSYEKENLSLQTCLYVRKLKCNLLSLLKLFHNKITTTRKEDSCILEPNNISLVKGKILRNILIANYLNSKSLLTSKSDNRRPNCLGHPEDGPLKSMGLQINSLPCRNSSINKANQTPFNNQLNLVQHPLDYVHIDLIGLISSKSVSSLQYFLTIVDQATLCKMAIFLKNKSNYFDQLLISKLKMENLHKQTIKKPFYNCGS
ncbi:hypothetical protein O181_019536 [Austropuccinia psidii MF-1]|uniref:Retrovirus-related Pol polyprotein from transposon TNT 1-94-like beta-barrel domain-containing protein n=1 Tax=Austropuccinia psidii MF-1 TaxID=1389203 RepID=A0A9Q3C7C8_9BASI|nr:hypothetical protein [Austropuccinia psidii MF-1]